MILWENLPFRAVQLMLLIVLAITKLQVYFFPSVLTRGGRDAEVTRTVSEARLAWDGFLASSLTGYVTSISVLSSPASKSSIIKCE